MEAIVVDFALSLFLVGVGVLKDTTKMFTRLSLNPIHAMLQDVTRNLAMKTI